MDCLNYQKQIPLLLDELLEAQEAAELKTHLLNCGKCRSERSRMERLFGLASASPSVAPSPEVWKRIRESLKAPAPLPLSERIRAGLDRAESAVLHYLPSYAAGALSAAALFIFFVSAKPSVSQDREILPGESPLQRVSSVSDSVPTESYPMRSVNMMQANPAKNTLYERDGQLFEVPNTQRRPTANYPVREVGMPAALKSRDF